MERNMDLPQPQVKKGVRTLPGTPALSYAFPNLLGRWQSQKD
jgi:hypothetical protein